MDDRYQLYLGDCLEIMRDIPDGSVDMVLCDPPYGTTHCNFDTVIPFEPMWAEYDRIVKQSGAILLFSAQPFTTDLICSNRKNFRYEIIYEKTVATGFLNAKKAPLRVHENICVFYRSQPTYNPQKMKIDNARCHTRKNNMELARESQQYGEYRKPDWQYTDDGTRYPRDIIRASNWNGVAFGKHLRNGKHPTKKPVPLLEQLILTYTDPGETVLDNCMGSGTTGVACINTGRRFIGVEKDQEYFELAKESIEAAAAQGRLEEFLTT
ncbi:MAG: cytosine methyltransferase [Clostridiaceae bacterium]|nr:MAG: cytosine methyltransferase [Clostridiaceae bacterium]